MGEIYGRASRSCHDRVKLSASLGQAVMPRIYLRRSQLTFTCAIARTITTDSSHTQRQKKVIRYSSDVSFNSCNSPSHLYRSHLCRFTQCVSAPTKRICRFSQASDLKFKVNPFTKSERAERKKKKEKEEEKERAQSCQLMK